MNKPTLKKETPEEEEAYVDYLSDIKSTDYDSDKAAAICDLVKTGESLKDSCTVVGVKEQVFHHWRSGDPSLDADYRRAIVESGVALAYKALDAAKAAKDKKLEAQVLVKISQLQGAQGFTKDVKTDSGKTPPIFGSFSILPKEHTYSIAYPPKEVENIEKDVDPHDLEQPKKAIRPPEELPEEFR